MSVCIRLMWMQLGVRLRLLFAGKGGKLDSGVPNSSSQPRIVTQAHLCSERSDTEALQIFKASYVVESRTLLQCVGSLSNVLYVYSNRSYCSKERLASNFLATVRCNEALDKINILSHTAKVAGQLSMWTSCSMYGEGCLRKDQPLEAYILPQLRSFSTSQRRVDCSRLAALLVFFGSHKQQHVQSHCIFPRSFRRTRVNPSDQTSL